MRSISTCLSFGAVLTSAVPALAQDPLPPAGPAPVATASAGGSDHAQTVGAWGFQLVVNESLGLNGANQTVPLLGVRRWVAPDTGWEAGAALIYAKQDNGAVSPQLIAIGGTFGWMRTLGIHEHMVVFWEPQGTVLVGIPDDDNAATDDENSFAVEARFNVGTEVRLGALGLPRLGLTAKLGAGLRVADDGNGTDISFGSIFGSGQNNSVEGLLDGAIGFVFYM
jgi:hypothetical protein